MRDLRQLATDTLVVAPGVGRLALGDAEVGHDLLTCVALLLDGLPPRRDVVDCATRLRASLGRSARVASRLGQARSRLGKQPVHDLGIRHPRPQTRGLRDHRIASIAHQPLRNA